MKPSKEDLSEVINLNREILSFFPSGDSMHQMYSKMSVRLEERLNLYDQFLDNPYKSPARQFKFNSDESLKLGEYNNQPRKD